MERKSAEKAELAVKITDMGGKAAKAMKKGAEYRIEIGGHGERPLVFALRLM
jgi:hypothetical protein